MTADPLVIEFELDATPDHAFDLWTRRPASWWPRSHTVSGAPASITFEPQLGGRIFERGLDGSEHAWGEILEWDPPKRLRYRWHLFFDPSEATEVEITFTAQRSRTSVRLVQRGWERLGRAGTERRERTGTAWAAITAALIEATATDR